MFYTHERAVSHVYTQFGENALHFKAHHSSHLFSTSKSLFALVLTLPRSLDLFILYSLHVFKDLRRCILR